MFQTQQWQWLKSPDIKRDPEFGRHLRDIERPYQIAFAKIMTVFDAMPLGVEFRHFERDAWAFVLPNVSSRDPWRIQYFDASSFSHHECFGSVELAVEDMVRGGYWHPDQGRLNAISATPAWRRGVLMLDLLYQVNVGKITWNEANSRLAAL